MAGISTIVLLAVSAASGPRTEAERIKDVRDRMAKMLPDFTPARGVLESPEKGVYIMNSPDDRASTVEGREKQDYFAFSMIMLLCRSLMGEDYIRKDDGYKVTIRYSSGGDIQSSTCGAALVETRTEYFIKKLL